MSFKYVKYAGPVTYFGFTSPPQTAKTFKLNKIFGNYDIELVHVPEGVSATCPGNTFLVKNYGYCTDKWVGTGEREKVSCNKLV